MSKKRTLAAALAEIDKRVDADKLLTPEMREMIKEKARKTVEERKRNELEKIALEAAIAEEERSYQVAEEWETVRIDLAPYAAMVMLDGVMYFHGVDYEVPYSVARTIEDICGRTWEHDNEIHGRRRRGGDVAWESRRKERYANGGVRVNSGDAANLQSAMTPRVVNTSKLEKVNI